MLKTFPRGFKPVNFEVANQHSISGLELVIRGLVPNRLRCLDLEKSYPKLIATLFRTQRLEWGSLIIVQHVPEESWGWSSIDYFIWR